MGTFVAFENFIGTFAQKEIYGVEYTLNQTIWFIVPTTKFILTINTISWVILYAPFYIYQIISLLAKAEN